MSKKHKTQWETLQKTYQRKGVVLVLGAGVSVGSGIPSWDELLIRLAQNTLAGRIVFEQLRSKGFSQTAIAGALEQVYGSRADFIANVRKALYENRKKNFHDNTTLRAVSAFCCSSLNGCLPNEKIHCVVSFNLDSLLENYTEIRYGKQIMQPVTHAASRTTSKYLSIYHVHGFIPFSDGKHRSINPENVVLTENDYFDFFGNPLGVFTYTFLHLLREHSCLFIGMSMRDDNVRRLLYYSRKERISALSRLTKDLYIDAQSRRHFAILETSDKATDEVIERALLSLGVNTLWLDDYSQLPDYFASIYESGGRAFWESVYRSV